MGESLEQTIERSREQRGLLAYSMVEGEQIEVGISGHVAEGVEVGESRIIVARSLGLPTGALEVIQDTVNGGDSWLNRRVCLGSLTFGLGQAGFLRGGLLRGFIGYDQAVAVDLTAQHFEAGDYECLPAQYKTLDLEGHHIF